MNKIITKSKLILGAIVVILIFSLVPSVAAAKSTKLDFNATECLDFDPTPPNPPPVPFPPTDIVGRGGVLHYKDYWSAHLLGGTIGDDVITGYTISLFHAKIDLDPTTGMPDFGNMILNGQTWFYFTWGDASGYFTGTVNAKVVNGALSGKFTLQGFEGFEGMKLFGIVGNDNIFLYPENELSGTILIPN